MRPLVALRKKPSHSRRMRSSLLTSAASAERPAAEAAAAACAEAAPSADLNASVEYREHLAKVLVRRALEECGL